MSLRKKSLPGPSVTFSAPTPGPPASTESGPRPVSTVVGPGVAEMTSSLPPSVLIVVAASVEPSTPPRPCVWTKSRPAPVSTVIGTCPVPVRCSTSFPAPVRIVMLVTRRSGIRFSTVPSSPKSTSTRGGMVTTPIRSTSGVPVICRTPLRRWAVGWLWAAVAGPASPTRPAGTTARAANAADLRMLMRLCTMLFSLSGISRDHTACPPVRFDGFPERDRQPVSPESGARRRIPGRMSHVGAAHDPS